MGQSKSKWREPMSVLTALNRACLAILAACVLAAPAIPQSSTAAAPDATSGYNKPPQNILDVMLAPAPPMPIMSPTNDTILLLWWQQYPSISRVATPYLRLAGVRVEPKNHSKHDTPGGYGITQCASGYDLVHVADGVQIHIALPEGACPGIPIWAADGERFAFANIASDSVELWIGDAKTGEAPRVP